MFLCHRSSRHVACISLHPPAAVGCPVPRSYLRPNNNQMADERHRGTATGILRGLACGASSPPPTWRPDRPHPRLDSDMYRALVFLTRCRVHLCVLEDTRSNSLLPCANASGQSSRHRRMQLLWHGERPPHAWKRGGQPAPTRVVIRRRGNQNSVGSAARSRPHGGSAVGEHVEAGERAIRTDRREDRQRRGSLADVAHRRVVATRGGDG